GDVAVYPNPARDVIHISLAGVKPGNYRVELISSAGQIMYKTEIKNNSATTINYMRTKSSPPGIYLVRITDIDEGTTETRKLLFE
ncbi:MAG TPA: T9SS type A sorting domain-containing protein, partial [Flavisolibacter sp.]|nr:T9SS type A sorting domain-containing protein [Flavisolibacter sp.]